MSPKREPRPLGRLAIGVESRASRERVLALGADPLLLRAARVLQASGVRTRRLEQLPRQGLPTGPGVLLTADDAELSASLVAARALAAKRRGGLRVIVLTTRGSRVDARGAGEAAEALADPEAVPGFRVEWLDPYRVAARTLLSRWPLHAGFDPLFGQTLHLVVAGFGPLNRAIALHAMRIGQYADAPPVISLADDRPERWSRWIETRHPMAEVCARLRFRPLREPGLDDAPPVSMMVVGASLAEEAPDPVLDSDPDSAPDPAPSQAQEQTPDEAAEQALAHARRLMQQSAAFGASPLVLLALDADWTPGPISTWDGQLVPVSPLDLAFSPDVLLGGRDDRLAEVVHEHYRDTSSAQGRDPAAAPSGRPWASLAVSYRDANRHQADHLGAKLALTDCRAVPEELVESFAFRPAELERLAIVEHRRWAVERWLDGWRFGPRRDNAAKLHPQLIPYADLSGPMKDLDRFAVRLVPTLLARSGLGVVRRLMVGVRAADADRAADVRLTRLRPAARQVLRRLSARYPDRGLTLAASLDDAPARAFARLASHRFGAGVLLLLTRPIAESLAGADADERREMLHLLEVAERRITLAGIQYVDDWLSRRASIQCVLGVEPDRAQEAAAGGVKRVFVDRLGGLTWTFEY